MVNIVTKDFEQLSPAEQRAATRRAAWFWGSLVVGFLTLQVAIGVVAIVLATGDESVAIVPDYYEKALKWDEQMEAERASAQLGWSHQLLVPSLADQRGRRTVMVRLFDAEGNPLSAAEGNLRVYHHARATDVQELRLESLGGGNYRAAAAMGQPGLWQVELEMRGPGGERFLVSDTVTIGPEGDREGRS
jgi:nitrogen fixation protein FixH